ncbi:hypothetical protein M2152_000705 [Microbacteriaceae bacterium SG_E_30_P1]|uniref:ABC transporter permease n=1 Tax=Antiquaquibacter oligotrophicus TaxID=2880260 RepID=A0ABT6KKK3_9MICO|nr:ABC transporter permease [Antiquaquibacter oligotrophicus]MDH6180523.1 hypothetical protein [Antiquaquibacter oligotrophicus]UDF13743.1 ABC transporter permease [Antiquaquibacter oligotrophicus]
MSTITAPSAVGPLGRIVNVVKLNTVNPWTTITLPWMILGFIFLANLVIWMIIFESVGPESVADVAEGLQYSGATTWIFVYMMIVAIQAINLTFPLALGYGVTRRDFWLGSGLTFIALSAMYSIGLTILSIIEEATGGWGLHGRMFTAVWFGETWPERLFVFFTLFMVAFFFGAAIATVYVRWKSNGVSAFFLVLSVLLIGAAALVTFTSNWPAVGHFFVTTGTTGVIAWTYVITLASALFGYLILRRATPKG